MSRAARIVWMVAIVALAVVIVPAYAVLVAVQAWRNRGQPLDTGV